MKVTKIPGLGRFGVFIDDVDLTTISHEEWMEIGQIHLESLVTIIRGNDLHYSEYYKLMTQWGPSRYNRPLQFYLKYGKPIKELVLNNELDEQDKVVFTNGRRWQMHKKMPGMIRVTPMKNEKGESIGLFGDGELLWHSNECADVAFTPGVALMGWQSMIGSCTGFCTSTDWYEAQSESFRSELDEMIVVHNYKRDRLQHNPIPEQEAFYKNNSCPEDNMEVPLVITSPGGIKGLHLGINTADYIKGMPKAESDKFWEKIRKEIFVDKYIYKHWYKSDKDICMFDNSITVHNREIDGNGELPQRCGLRIQFDYDYLTGKPWAPFAQDEYNKLRFEKIRLLNIAMEGMEVRN
jgi:alpha-ketoglutarate-dependent taurine dioxygenase